MRTSLISTVAAIALIGASAPFVAQAGSLAPDYQMAAGADDKQSGEMRDEQGATSRSSDDGGAYGGSAQGSGESMAAEPPAQAVLPEQERDQTLADNLIGTPVRTASGEDGEEIGTVNDLVLDADNRVTAVVIGVGGFLGVGAKDVAVAFDQLEKAQAEGRTVLIADLNRAQLEQAPEFVTQEEKAQQQATGEDQQGSGSSGMSSQ